MRKGYGASGQPCLNPPHSILKLVFGLPLKLTVVVALTNKSLTHLIKGALIFNFLIVLKRKIHETLSYAFEKSSFRKTICRLDVFAQCKVYWINTMLSKMNLRGRKVVCSGLITSLSMGCDFSCKVLAKIL